ncbi:hypothetical protein ABPG74_009625 [Tetrahymena malaccensis]
MSEEKFAFITEWYDTNASLVRVYHLYYYLHDGALEMYDAKTKKLFLKKCDYPSIQLKDLYIGAIVNIFSRQHKIVDYADNFTRNNFDQQRQKTLALIKPDAYTNIGKIIQAIEDNNFTINNLKMCKLNLRDAQEFYAEHRGKTFYDELTNYMCSDFIVAIELVGNDCINQWKRVMGPTNCQVARVDAPQSLRAIFGQDGVKNSLHGSDSATTAKRELDFFFSKQSQLKKTAIFKNCTCCVIKPHVVKQKLSGKIIDIILSEGYEISAMQSFFLDRPTSEEFLDLYKGVLPDFIQIVDHLASGLCIALEVRQENVVQNFRELCGPFDPQIAKQSRPNSIRAQFGIDRVRNAVHCTDLQEDGLLEVEFFFCILQNQ